MNLNKPGVREEMSGKEMTIGEAFEEGVLHMHPVSIRPCKIGTKSLCRSKSPETNSGWYGTSLGQHSLQSLETSTNFRWICKYCRG